MSTNACTSLPAWFDLSADRCQPCQSVPALHHFSCEHPMSDFKQLSRSVKGLTVLVTGAASGMGRATAHVFAAEGAKVAGTAITPDGTRAVADAMQAPGGKARAWARDVASGSNINTRV